jgi:hypothetical protein
MGKQAIGGGFTGTSRELKHPKQGRSAISFG